MVHAAEVERLQPAADNRLLQLCEAPRRTSANLLLGGYIEKSLQSCGEKRLSDARRQRLRHDRRAPIVAPSRIEIRRTLKKINGLSCHALRFHERRVATFSLSSNVFPRVPCTRRDMNAAWNAPTTSPRRGSRLRQ
jgi:hypothetical protein